jgi:hypothetical protein
MRILLFITLLFLASCDFNGDKSAIDTKSISGEQEIDSLTNEVLAVNSAPPSMCGVTPYLLLGDAMFTDSVKGYDVALRVVKISREIEPDRLNVRFLNKAIERANEITHLARLNIVLEEAVIIEDKKAYQEGIKQFFKHASKYGDRGYITLLIYPDRIDSNISGIANGIPGTVVGVKEHYLRPEYSTFAHEICHIFGLLHLFTHDDSGEKNSWEYGDEVCGTYAADFFADESNKGYIGRVTDNCTYVGPLGNLTQEEHNLNIRNIMNYSPAYCRDYLHEDQIGRMHFIISMSQDLKESMTISNLW